MHCRPAVRTIKITTISLRNELEISGSWLFRHRSYLPLLIVPLFLVGMVSFTYLSRDHTVNEAWQILCMLISFLGLAVRIITVGRAVVGKNSSSL
jgi:hypothetical protein